MICKLASIEEIGENTLHEFSVQTADGLVSIMLLKKRGQYTAFKNSCPHQGRRMDYSLGKFLTTPEGNIVCPAHGAEFTLAEGLCINGPCLGESLQKIHIQENEKDIFAVL